LKQKCLYSISRKWEISRHFLYFCEISILWKFLFLRNFRNNRPNVSCSQAVFLCREYLSENNLVFCKNSKFFLTSPIFWTCLTHIFAKTFGKQILSQKCWKFLSSLWKVKGKSTFDNFREIFPKIFTKNFEIYVYFAKNFTKMKVFVITLFFTYGYESREAGQHQQDSHPVT
jgi:hypothetical protein